MSFTVSNLKQLQRHSAVGVTYEVPTIQRVKLTDADEKIGVMSRMCVDILKLEYGVIDKTQTDKRFLDYHAQAHTKPYVVRETWSDGPDPVFMDQRLMKTTKYKFFDDIPTMEEYLIKQVNRVMRKGWRT